MWTIVVLQIITSKSTYWYCMKIFRQNAFSGKNSDVDFLRILLILCEIMFSRMRPKGCNGRLTKYCVYFYYVFPIYGLQKSHKRIMRTSNTTKVHSTFSWKKIAKRSFRGTLTFSILGPKFNTFFCESKVRLQALFRNQISIKVKDRFILLHLWLMFHFLFYDGRIFL